MQLNRDTGSTAHCTAASYKEFNILHTRRNSASSSATAADLRIGLGSCSALGASPYPCELPPLQGNENSPLNNGSGKMGGADALMTAVGTCFLRREALHLVSWGSRKRYCKMSF